MRHNDNVLTILLKLSISSEILVFCHMKKFLLREFEKITHASITIHLQSHTREKTLV